MFATTTFEQEGYLEAGGKYPRFRVGPGTGNGCDFPVNTRSSGVSRAGAEVREWLPSLITMARESRPHAAARRQVRWPGRPRAGP